MFLRLKGLIYNSCLPLPQRTHSLGFIGVNMYHFRHCPLLHGAVLEKGKVRQAHVLRCQSWSIFCMYIETALLRMCACIYAVGGFHPTTLLLASLLPLLLSRGPSPVTELSSTGSTLVTGTQDRQRFLNA